MASTNSFSMIVEGRQIAEGVFNILRTQLEGKGGPALTVFTCAPDFATKKFLTIKKERAHTLGIPLEVIELEPTLTTHEVMAKIQDTILHTNGIIVQLPFPKDIAIQEILDVLPESHDVDAIGKEATGALVNNTQKVLPPVVAAIALLVEKYKIKLKEKNVLVVGEGRLVGRPAAMWFRNQGAKVTTLNRKSEHIDEHAWEHTKTADILVLGAGVPGLVTPEMIQEGVVIFDAGTSEEGGRLVGDADPSCSEKASFFTPVPRGIGPITVAMIFQNLMTLRAAGLDAPHKN